MVQQQQVSPWKRLLGVLLKVGISAGILTWLLTRPNTWEAFAEVSKQPKRWDMLAGAVLAGALTVAATIIRWHWLLRTAGIPIPWFQTLRLGFLGYTLNFVSLGSIGGDAFKGFILYRDYPGFRARALASVMVDRIVGLLGLFWLVMLVTIVTGLAWSPKATAAVQGASLLAAVCAFLGMAAVAVFLSPLFRERLSQEQLDKLPKLLGGIFLIVRAVRVYRHHPAVLIASLVFSIGTHFMFGVVAALVAWGLNTPDPTMAVHLIAVPLGNLAATVPLPGGGLGAMEWAMASFYAQVSTDPAITLGVGTVIAFGFRAMTISVALIGFAYYLTCRPDQVPSDFAPAAFAESGQSDNSAHPGYSAQSANSATLANSDRSRPVTDSHQPEGRPLATQQTSHE